MWGHSWGVGSQKEQAHGAGGMPSAKLKLEDKSDFSAARFMESYESKHSDQSFTSKLAKDLGVTAAPLRLDSQAKYGESLTTPWCLNAPNATSRSVGQPNYRQQGL